MEAELWRRPDRERNLLLVELKKEILAVLKGMVNSGSSATTPPEPTGEIPHTLTVVLQLAEFLHNQGWLRVDTLTWGKLSYSQGGKCPVQIQVTLPTSTTGWPTSGAKENPGGQPTLNTQEGGGTAYRVPRRAKSNEADDATPK